MSQTIEVTLSWADNSTGALEETGQEIDIYTDSPSFVPNVPINYSEARHPWMRLPPVAAGEESAVLILRTPVTFVKFRVRQYNAQGNGEWPAPQVFTITRAGGSAVPPSPGNLGMAVTSGGTPPPPPPVDPPPPPPPTGGGGSSSNYSYAAQFSGVQGQDGWSYRDSSGALLTYVPADVKWVGVGSEVYLAAWGTGFRHSGSGSIRDCVVRFTVPEAGELNVTGTFKLYTTPGSVTVKIQHNGSDIFSQDITDGTVYAYDEDVTVGAGDTIDFISRRLDPAFYNNNVELNPNIQLTTDGVTPTNPIISALAPATLTIASNGEGSLLISLSSAPSSQATISLSSSDATKATVPATVVIPSGQISVTVPVTGVAAGGTTITATYNSSSKQAVVTVSAPVSSAWSNAPAGGVLLLNHGFATVLGPGMTGGVGGNGGIITDASAPFSPTTVLKTRLEIGTQSGGAEIHCIFPTAYREIYVGMWWRTNPQWTGRSTADKMFFIRGANSNGFFGLLGGIVKGGSGSQPFLHWAHNSGNVLNNHIMAGPEGGIGYPNITSSPMSPGVWSKIEVRVKCSTTLISRDGEVHWWINGVLSGSYTTVNYGTAQAGLNEFVWAETWDGSGTPVHPVPLEHYIDHVLIMGRN